jgi:hypothetical protein
MHLKPVGQARDCFASGGAEFVNAHALGLAQCRPAFKGKVGNQPNALALVSCQHLSTCRIGQSGF